MHDGNGRGMPQWASERLYTVKPEQVSGGATPWVMGGRDLTPPSDEAMQAYHRAGLLAGVSSSEWAEAMRAEGLFMQPGPQGMTGEGAHEAALYRHVTERGRVLWTPRPGTHLYQRLTRTEHPSYTVRGPLLSGIIAGQRPVNPSDIISRPASAAASQGASQ
jgi:hypothetical protein